MEPITLALIGAGAAWAASKAVGSMESQLGGWTPPPPPASPSDPPVVAIDPRIRPTGIALGVGLPCPNNPPPPVGWTYWKNQSAVTTNLTAFCSKLLGDTTAYPIGSFVQEYVDGVLTACRIEYHNLVGATGTTGCFRGTNLMQPVSG